MPPRVPYNGDSKISTEVEAREFVLKLGFHDPSTQLIGKDHQRGNKHKSTAKKYLFTSVRYTFGL